MKRVKLDVKDLDPKKKERATVVLLNFRPLLKLEKKLKFQSTLLAIILE